MARGYGTSIPGVEASAIVLSIRGETQRNVLPGTLLRGMCNLPLSRRMSYVPRVIVPCCVVRYLRAPTSRVSSAADGNNPCPRLPSDFWTSGTVVIAHFRTARGIQSLQRALLCSYIGSPPMSRRTVSPCGLQALRSSLRTQSLIVRASHPSAFPLHLSGFHPIQVSGTALTKWPRRHQP